MRRLIIYCVFGMLVLSAANHISAQKTIYSNTLLYRISGKDLAKPSYLYGTMHLQDRRLFQFSDSLYHFLEHSDGFAMEVDPEEIVEALMNALSQPDTSGLLKDVMDEKEFRRIAGNLETQFGVPADKITKRQAWLYQQGWKNKSKVKADDMDAAMDMYLYNIARRQGKWVGGIEDVEDQLDLLNDLGDRFNGEDLGLGVYMQQAALEKLIKIYIDQDMNKLNDWCGMLDSATREGMLVKRNKKMARRIDSLAHIRSNFFAVGAAHLPGSNGLIHLLQEAGYQVEAVVSKKKVAPGAYHYKPLDLPWYTVENEEKTYQASMPGKAISFSPYSNIIKMKVYADMGTGILYFITSIQAPGDRSIDSVMAQIAKNYAGSGNHTKPSKFEFEGKPGMETTFSANGYFYRIRMLAETGQVVMMMTGSTKKELLYNKEAERFYHSIKTNPVSLTKRNSEWFLYTDEERAFEVNFPSKPSFSKEYHQGMIKEASEEWAFTNQVYVDLINQVWYTVAVKETKPGYYISNIEEILSAPKEQMVKNGTISLIKYETGEFDGYPCMWIDGRFKDNALKMKMFSIVRGNRNFALMVFADKSADTTNFNKFLSSFKFHDFKKQDWETYSDSTGTFTTLAPAPSITLEKDLSSENVRTSVFYDKMSGSSFYVNAETLSPYYWTASDSAFFAESVKGYVGTGDSLLTAQKVQNGAAAGMEYLIRVGTDGTSLKKLRMLLNGDTIYSLVFIAPKQSMAVKQYNRFFEDFQFKQYNGHEAIFTNKTQKILEDINSTDSAIYENAKSYLRSAPFTKADLPLLHKAMMQPYHDLEQLWDNVHDDLLSRVVEFSDESTVDFIKQNYSSLNGENEELKYLFLRALAQIPTPKSYSVLKDLLIRQLPVKGNPGGLGNDLGDHKELAATLYPEILPLVSDSLFSDALITATKRLIDSNAVRIEELEPYQSEFLQQAKRVFTTIISGNEDDSWKLYYWISLLGKFNDVKSNQLLQQFAASDIPDIQYDAAIELIANSQVVSPVILEKIAADKNYRLSFYEDLRKKDKLKFFPVRYQKQRSIAESELYVYASDDEEPSKMEYIGERISVYKGKKQKFYLFKIRYTYADSSSESYLGVAGPYPLTPGAIITEGAVTGMYYKTTFDPKRVDQQFKEYLEDQEEYAKEQINE